jgi:thiosulfate/3-mercaptopyruvate sulfurtransferase
MKNYPYPGGDAPVRWVDTQWLSEHLDEADLTILDVQSNIHEYIKGHIPGAVYVNEGLFRFHGQKLPTEWFPAEAAQMIFSLYGLSSDKPVVVYTGSPILTGCTTFVGDGLEQPFAAYTFARFGHNKVYILDGGIDTWRAEGRPLSQTFSSPRAFEFKANIRSDYFIGYNEFRSIKDRSDVVVLDARPPQFYEGQGPWIRPGHIPGAINLPWKSLMSADNPRKVGSGEEIAAILKERGVSPDKTIICSCGTGREATNEFVLFKFYLKYPKVRLYEGSFTEWTMYPDNPVVTGKNPR